MLKTWKYINDILTQFKDCFSRKASFGWFVNIVIGLLIRTEHIGITSIIRALGIAGHFYESLIHFFHASSWELKTIQEKWIQILNQFEQLYMVDGKLVLIGDGVKQSKEARKMPGVKKLFQESENSSKPGYIFGHMFGAIGLLLGNSSKIFCAPVSMKLHDGNEVIGEWAKDELAKETHVVRLIREACDIAAKLIPSFLLLDRYFLTVPALKALSAAEGKIGRKLLTIVVKAKSNAVAYEKPEARSGRGRPRKKGKTVKLKEVFATMSEQFVHIKTNMYGKVTEIEYLCLDLLWGQKLYQELRFVLVKYDGKEAILVSTDILLSPERIIELYCLRFKIECCFRELKQVISGFSYRFWSKSMPKLNRYQKNTAAQKDVKNVKDKAKQTRILSAYKAIEGYTMFSCIAMGIVQMVSLMFHKEINASDQRFLRTRSNKFPSEASTVDFLRKSFFCMFQNPAVLPIIRFIQTVQSHLPCDNDSHIA